MATRSSAFSAEERAAMKQRAAEQKRNASRGSGATKADGESDVQAKIAEMTGTDKELAERLHVLIKEAAPELEPKTWYGFPSYATPGKGGKIVCFFQPAAKFKNRYATFNFSDPAHLDDGGMWPIGYALTELTPDIEARITALIKQAVS